MLKKTFSGNPAGPYALFLPAVIALVSLAVYLNALPNGFVYDDNKQILNNPWITGISHLPDIFTRNTLAFRDAESSYYRPVMHVAYMAGYHLFGPRAWGFHLMNILLHAASSVLVFMLISRLLETGGRVAKSALPAFLGALLFAVHPIHTEAVVGIAMLPELSFSLFYLLSFYFYVTAGENPALSKGRYAISAAAFLVSAFSKEPALTLPVMLVAYDYSAGRSDALSSRIRRYSPYIAVAVFYLTMRFVALGAFAPAMSAADLGRSVYIANAFVLFGQYMKKLLFPFNLNFWHMFHFEQSAFTATAVASYAFAAAFLAAAAVAARRRGPAMLGMAFLAVPLAPALYSPYLIQGLSYSFGERYLYLPSFGFVLLAAAVAEGACDWRRGRSAFIAGALALAVLCYGACTVHRNPDWADDYTIWSDSAAKSPDNLMAHKYLGITLYDMGHTEEAVAQFEYAAGLNPTLWDIRYLLGAAYEKAGRADEAVGQYMAALEMSPDTGPIHASLGRLYQREGMYGPAIEHLERAASLEPSAGALNALGAAYSLGGRTDDAIIQFRKAARLDPSSAAAWYNLGTAYQQTGRHGDAVEAFKAALRLRPDDADTHNNLGTAYANEGRLDMAAAEFEAAVRLEPGNTGFRDNLAAAQKGMRPPR